jgi:arylsulfatase A-like enzyme
MGRQPNILLAVLDTVRAQNCSCCGYNRQTTPYLDALAKEGIYYTNAITPAPWTLPAHVSLFTGQYCFDHQVDGRRYKLGSDHTLLTDMLSREGYATAGITSNVWISDTFGFDRGFDYFHKTWPLFQDETESVSIVKLDSDARAGTLSKIVSVLRTREAKTILNALYAKVFAKRRDQGASQVTEKAIQWLKRPGDSPFFLFLNYMDPHAPYLPPKPYRQTFAAADLTQAEIRRLAALSRRGKGYHMGHLAITEREFEILTDLYDEEILYTDAQLGLLLDYLRSSGELDRTLVIVVSDHGENIGDHNLMEHRFSLHQTLLWVPLVMRYPEAISPGTVEDTRVQLTDVVPSVLSAIGRGDLIPELQLSGVDLLSHSMDTERAALAEYLSTDYTAEARSSSFDFQNSRFNRTMRAFYEGDYKLVESQVDDRHELYNLAIDPREEHNLATNHPELVDSVRADLRQFLEQHGFAETDYQKEEFSVDRSIEDRLRALGYLG